MSKSTDKDKTNKFKINELVIPISIDKNINYTKEKAKVIQDFELFKKENKMKKQEKVEITVTDLDIVEDLLNEEDAGVSNKFDTPLDTSGITKVEALVDPEVDESSTEIAQDAPESTEAKGVDCECACGNYENCESYKASQGDGVSVSQLLKLPSKHGRCQKCGVSLTKEGKPRKRRA